MLCDILKWYPIHFHPLSCEANRWYYRHQLWGGDIQNSTHRKSTGGDSLQWITSNFRDVSAIKKMEISALQNGEKSLSQYQTHPDFSLVESPFLVVNLPFLVDSGRLDRLILVISPSHLRHLLTIWFHGEVSLLWWLNFGGFLSKCGFLHGCSTPEKSHGSLKIFQQLRGIGRWSSHWNPQLVPFLGLSENRDPQFQFDHHHLPHSNGNFWGISVYPYIPFSEAPFFGGWCFIFQLSSLFLCFFLFLCFTRPF